MMLFFESHNWIYSMALASARLAAVFILLPFFNTNVLTGTIRLPVIMLTGSALCPDAAITIQPYENSFILLLIIKELIVGLVIACFVALPFWILHAVGSFIDNQRGATLSSSIDPISGIDTSELANLFNLFSAVIVLESGGLVLLLEIFKNSYATYGLSDLKFPEINEILRFFPLLMNNAIILASPLIICFLLTEILLGLLARFSPQLNAFAIALTVKSIIGFLLLFIYFTPVFPDKIIGFSRIYATQW